MSTDIIRDVDIASAGAGAQGIALASFVLNGVIEPDRFLMIDPHPTPLSVLRDRFEDCCTEILRSPHTHNLDCNEQSLIEFARMQGREEELRTKWQVPTVPLFLAHTEEVCRKRNLADCHLQAYVASFSREDSGAWLLHTTAGTVRTKRLDLAVGQQMPSYPDFGIDFHSRKGRFCHVFQRDYSLQDLPVGCCGAVIGGAITAEQVSASIVDRLGRNVLLVTRREIDSGASQTSTPDDWLDPERRAHLCSLPWDDRDALLKGESDRGTMPPWGIERLQRNIAAGKIEHVVGNVAMVSVEEEASTVIFEDGTSRRLDFVVLATGLVVRLPGWLLQTAHKVGLPLDKFARPVLQDDLEWGEGSNVFFHGPLADRVIGPYAKNIIGARIAAEMCVESLAFTS